MFVGTHIFIAHFDSLPIQTGWICGCCGIGPLRQYVLPIMATYLQEPREGVSHGTSTSTTTTTISIVGPKREADHSVKPKIYRTKEGRDERPIQRSIDRPTDRPNEQTNKQATTPRNKRRPLAVPLPHPRLSSCIVQAVATTTGSEVPPSSTNSTNRPWHRDNDRSTGPATPPRCLASRIRSINAIKKRGYRYHPRL